MACHADFKCHLWTTIKHNSLHTKLITNKIHKLLCSKWSIFNSINDCILRQSLNIRVTDHDKIHFVNGFHFLNNNNNHSNVTNHKTIVQMPHNSTSSIPFARQLPNYVMFDVAVAPNEAPLLAWFLRRNCKNAKTKNKRPNNYYH